MLVNFGVFLGCLVPVAASLEKLNNLAAMMKAPGPGHNMRCALTGQFDQNSHIRGLTGQFKEKVMPGRGR
jgi:hypothetical protein